MNARRTLVLVALLIPLLSAPAQSKPGGFKLCDAMTYAGKPERFNRLPIQPIQLMSSVVIFPKEVGSQGTTAAEHPTTAAKALPSLGAPIVIDIEAWPVHAWGDIKLSDAERADSVRKLTFVVRTLKQARPDLEKSK